MKICTPKQMQAIDRMAIDTIGVPGLELMENAGRSVYEMIVNYYGPVENNRVTVVCGKGNNGGDGHVLARCLQEDGAQVEIILLCKKDAPKGDAKINLDKAIELGVKITEVENPNQFHIADDSWLIIDAIFGTGFSGDIKAPYDKYIDIINESGIPVVAIDSPSGLDGETGLVSRPSIKADLTVTFGLPKIGQVLYPGKAFCGFLEVVDIGFPEGIDDDINSYLVSAADAAMLLPMRLPDAHKGDYGKLLVLAGSTGLTGAATLSSLSALRSGTGLVVLGCPVSLNQIMEIKLTEVMTKPLPDVKKRGALSLRGLGEIRQQINWADAVAIGPGIGTHHETIELVTRLVEQTEKPLVVDADGLNCLAKNIERLKNHKGDLILTPHPGEFERLSGFSTEDIESNRFEKAAEFAAEYDVVLVLKGAPTIIASPDGDIFINNSGNDGMATGGSGDVLTGLIGGFLAQGISSIDAAVLGCYLHGMAADIAIETKGTRSLIAGDIVESIAEAMLELEDTPFIEFDI